MNVQPAKLLVSVCGQDVCLQIKGRANFASGPDFKTLVTELQQRGYRHFVIDMSECQLMDSTFLGLLCGLCLGLREGGNGGAGVEILNPNPRVTELLESLGVISIVKLVVGQREPGEATTTACAPHSREELARASLEAHEALMSLSSENAARFKDVTQFLAEDLKRLKAAADSSAGSSAPG